MEGLVLVYLREVLEETLVPGRICGQASRSWIKAVWDLVPLAEVFIEVAL